MSIREKMEAEILRRVREDGGFGIFWICSNRLRAAAGERLVKRGEIVQDGDGGRFPWCAFKLGKEQKP